MTIVSSLLPFLQVFFLAMNDPTSRSFVELITGWIFLPGRSLADRIRAIGGERHPAAYYRVLSTTSWSMDEVSCRLLALILRLSPQETLFLVGDDTLLPHKGKKVYGAGMHRDAVLSKRGQTFKRWGHSWVVLGVLLPSRHHPGRYFSLPVLVQLHLNHSTAEKCRRAYRKKSTLMIDMVRQVERLLPDQKLHFIGDYGYTAPALLSQFPPKVEVTGRARSDSRLYEPAPPHVGTRGRPRVRGDQLPSPTTLLEGRTERREYEVAPGRRYRVRQASITGCFFQAPARQVKVVALEHLQGKRENDVFYSTATETSIEQVVRWYNQRWSIEVTFHDCKQHLGVGRERNRTCNAARNTAAIGLLLYSLVVLWHETAPQDTLEWVRNYPGKQHASFADMLARLRRESLREYHQNHIRQSPDLSDWLQINQYLEKLLLLAA